MEVLEWRKRQFELIVEWMKRNASRWYGHVKRMPEKRMTKKVSQSEIQGELGRGRSPMTWETTVEEYRRE